MPVTLTYPGVYVEEIASGVRTITGVATSITAFVGRAKRGPTDIDGPIVINSFGDFERVFGGLWTESTLGFAVRDFYLNGGSQAVIVRLFNPTFANAAARQTALAAATTEAQTAADAVKAKVDTAVTAAGATAQSVATEAQAAVAAAQPPWPSRQSRGYSRRQSRDRCCSRREPSAHAPIRGWCRRRCCGASRDGCSQCHRPENQGAPISERTGPGGRLRGVLGQLPARTCRPQHPAAAARRSSR